MAEIFEVSTPAEIEIARTLFGEYKQAVGVDLWFGSAFQKELEGLPAPYVPPRGRLVLAKVGDEIAGCGAVRPHESGAAELRRLWVRKQFRKHGIARQIMESLMDWSRTAGYRTARLEVLTVQAGAEPLFKALGFAPLPEDRKSPFPGSILMGRRL